MKLVLIEGVILPSLKALSCLIIYAHGKKITDTAYAQPPLPSSLVNQTPIFLK